MRQYWLPHVLRARVEGFVEVDERWSLDGATAYAERNWGNGFPPEWWWGEAHDFRGGDPVTVAFAGGPALGPLRATAVVVHVGGRLVRLGEPVLAGVREDLAPGRWALRGRSLRHRVEIEASAVPAAAHILDVPVPGERRTVPWSHQHLAGRAARARHAPRAARLRGRERACRARARPRAGVRLRRRTSTALGREAGSRPRRVLKAGKVDFGEPAIIESTLMRVWSIKVDSGDDDRAD